MATIVKAYHGFSSIGNSTRESYEKLLQKQALFLKLDDEKKQQVKSILKDIDHLRIKVPLHHLETKNRLICEGPLKIRYAQLILEKMKEHINFKDSHFYASNMDDYCPVGMRNTFRILSDKNFDFDEDTYLKGAVKALKHLNPITPLLNIPNNLLSIIALEHRLKNSNVNFMGDNSSSQAIYNAINRVSASRFKEVFVLSSMFLHFNFVNYLLYFEQYDHLESFIQSPISEYAGGIIFQEQKEVSGGQIEVLYNQAFPPIIVDKVFSLKEAKAQIILEKYYNKMIDGLKESKLDYQSIDLVLFQGFHQPLIDLLEKNSQSFLNITPFNGYNLCSSGMALSHYACEFLNNNDQIKNVLVIEQGVQGSLWTAVFHKTKDHS
ncbi:hypothetical protein MJH12_06385 [bacterium]|nr:hypothetical protein [bacterium]